MCHCESYVKLEGCGLICSGPWRRLSPSLSLPHSLLMKHTHTDEFLHINRNTQSHTVLYRTCSWVHLGHCWHKHTHTLRMLCKIRCSFITCTHTYIHANSQSLREKITWYSKAPLIIMWFSFIMYSRQMSVCNCAWMNAGNHKSAKCVCCSHLIGQLVSALLHVWQLIAHVCVICHGCWMWGVEKVSNREEKILVGIRGGL